MRRIGASVREFRAGTERGTGPAPSASPVYPASTSRPASRSASSPPRGPHRFEPSIVREVANRRPPDVLAVQPEEELGAELAIEEEFKRRLLGLRRLSKHDRPHALRAARYWRALALRALRERRAELRYARRQLRRACQPNPK